MPAAKAQLGPAVAMVVVAVVAGWGRRFACSWPGSCQAACREFCLRFCLRFGFVPERKTRRENETARWKKYLQAESRNLTKCKCSRRKNKIGKKQTGTTERNEGGKEANRNCHRKGMNTRKDTKGRQGKTGKNQTTTTPWYTILDVRFSNGNLSTNISCKVCLRFKGSPSFLQVLSYIPFQYISLT